MKDVIGKIVEELLSKEGAPKRGDLAQMLGMAPKTLYNVIKGESSMDFDQVVKASEIFKFNIVEEFQIRTGKLLPKNQLKDKSHNMVTVTISLSANINAYGNFPELLNGMKKQAKELGFDIS